MTDFFEVHDRDGAARLGELRLRESTQTPALADPIVADSGSLWPAEREPPDGDPAALTVLPHRAFPAGTPDEIREVFTPEHEPADFPAAVVVSSTRFETTTDEGDTDSGSESGLGLGSRSAPGSRASPTPDATNSSDAPSADEKPASRPAQALADGVADAYLLSDAQRVIDHGEIFCDAIVRTRGAIPADTALFLSGVATPGNVALLAYAGVDLVDTAQARVAGAEGFYLATDGRFVLEDLEELPCACEACRRGIAAFDRGDCATHNVNALKAELARVRERIRAGQLRDYLEGQARHEQWITAALREFDQQWGYLEQRTPIFREAEITATTGDTLQRVAIRRFADRVTTRYQNRFDSPLVLVGCSATKPYSQSQSHEQLHDAIDYRGHVVSMTSPIGVVPQELETTYPAQHYDTVVTSRWTETETAFVTQALEKYLQANEYPRIIAHVPSGGYRDICERVCNRVDIEMQFTTEGHPTSEQSLAALAETLNGESRYHKRERQHNTIQAIADYQFGAGAGEELFDQIQTTGRYPRLQAWDRDGADRGAQLATMVPQYGLLALTEAGGQRWLASDVSTHHVEIDEFVPHGSVLAPGVVDASADIRTGEEVVIQGPRAFAVGRAQMTGPEMVDSTRGVACSVRHVTETET